MKEKNKFLPVGSIIKLSGLNEPFMIIGHYVRKLDTDLIYDYLGCIYPLGFLSVDYNIMFDEDLIEEVVYIGYSDELNERYMNQLGTKIDMNIIDLNKIYQMDNIVFNNGNDSSINVEMNSKIIDKSIFDINN